MSDNDLPAVPPPSRNPFVGNGSLTVAQPSVGALASTEQQRALGELQAQIMLAKLYPRDPQKCTDDILRDCTRVGLAERAQYAYARGGTDVSGPSIRLMETIARRWGNIQSGIKEVSRDTVAGTSECIAYAWDVETGYRDERQFQVRHFRDVRNRTTRKMEQVRVTDERDIYEMVANMGQRRKRACLEAVIPGDVVQAAVEQCTETLQAKADTGPEAMKRMLTAFAKVGITQAMIEQKLQRRIDAIRPAQVVQLDRIYTAIKDGVASVTDHFQVDPVMTWPLQQGQQPPQEPAQAPPESTPPPTPEPPPEPPAAASPLDYLPPEDDREREGRFEYVVLDEGGEPVADGEVFLDPLAWAQEFLADWTKSNNRAALEAHNADAIADARDMSPEADALLDALVPMPELPIDKDQALASDILGQVPKLATAAEVLAYSKSPAVLTPIRRWENEGRTGLVTSVKAAFTARLEALRRGG